MAYVPFGSGKLYLNFSVFSPVILHSVGIHHLPLVEGTYSPQFMGLRGRPLNIKKKLAKKVAKNKMPVIKLIKKTGGKKCAA
jgi:hypothetical protein